MPTRANDPIEKQIKAEKRLMDGYTLLLLKKAAKKENVSQDSLIWIITDVYSSGKVRSNGWVDVPEFVKDDGLVEEHDICAAYLSWRFTDKAKQILDKRK